MLFTKLTTRTAEERDGEIFFVGFDFFFFDKIVIDCYPKSNFCLGVPWWDYWAPLIPLLNGIPCKEIVTPLAFHHWHETKWSADHFYRFGEELAEYLRSLSRSGRIDAVLADGLAELEQTVDLTVFSFPVLKFILTESLQLDLLVQLPATDHVMIGMRQFETMRQTMIDQRKAGWLADKQQANFQGALDAEREFANREREALSALQSSLSWRLTAPLRRLVDIVRR